MLYDRSPFCYGTVALCIRTQTFLDVRTLQSSGQHIPADKKKFLTIGQQSLNLSNFTNFLWFFFGLVCYKIFLYFSGIALSGFCILNL